MQTGSKTDVNKANLKLNGHLARLTLLIIPPNITLASIIAKSDPFNYSLKVKAPLLCRGVTESWILPKQNKAVALPSQLD